MNPASKHFEQERHRDVLLLGSFEQDFHPRRRFVLRRQKLPAITRYKPQHHSAHEHTENAGQSYTWEQNRNDNKKKNNGLSLLKPSELPEHVQQMMKPSKIDLTAAVTDFRSGMNAYNDLEDLQNKIRTRIKTEIKYGTKFKQLIRKKKPEPVGISEKSKSSSCHLLYQDDEESEHSVHIRAENLAKYTIRTTRRFQLIKSPNEDFVELEHPACVLERYHQATEFIRFELPSNLSSLDNLSPIDYLAKYTRLRELMRMRYKRLFAQFKEKSGKGQPDFLRQIHIYDALNRLCDGFLSKRNYQILVMHTMVIEHELRSEEFHGLCALCERLYWSLCIDKPAFWGHRTRLEALDFNALYQWQSLDLLQILRNLLISLR